MTCPLADPAAPPPAPSPLPPGWRWARLGDLCTQDRRIIAPNTELAARLPYLGLEHIESQTGRILAEPAEAPEETGTSTSFAFDSRHVLYGKLRPYLNKVALPAFSGRCTTELIPLLPTGSDRAFLAWLLRSPDTVEMAMRGKTGARMPRADMNDFLGNVVSVPPLAEQRRIAALLTEQMAAVDRARAAAKAQLATAEALPAAYLRAVFDSERAKAWRKRRLGDVCEIQLGKMLSPASKTGSRPRPYLRNANVQWGRFALDDILEMDFTEAEEAKFALRPGDLLVCEGGEPGRAAVWQGQIPTCCYQKALHRLRPLQGEIVPEFLMYRLWRGSQRGEFLESDKQTTILHLPAVRLAELRIGVPSVDEQQTLARELASAMAGVNAARTALSEQLGSITAMSAALLRQAFTGRL